MLFKGVPGLPRSSWSTTRPIFCDLQKLCQFSSNSRSSQFYKQIEEKNESIEIACVVNPHPHKLNKGGEDAYFISKNLKSFGVADGVGGWIDKGVDPSLYSKRILSLIEHDEEKVENYNSNTLYTSVFNAHSQITKEDLLGSTTICIAKIVDNQLFTFNLGDSGYLIVPSSPSCSTSPFIKSEKQQKGYEYPYQLGIDGDEVAKGEQHHYDLSEGDIVLIATDGVLDNLSHEYIYEQLKNNKSDSILSLATNIMNDANLVSRNIHPNTELKNTPFSKSSPFLDGGKIDDMTLIIARIRSL